MEFKITGEYIELCDLLKVTKLVNSGGEAKQAIIQNLVKVNGELETRIRRKCRPQDRVEFKGQTILVL